MNILFVLCGLAVPLIAIVALMGEGGKPEKVMRERLARRPPESRVAPVAPAVRGGGPASTTIPSIEAADGGPRTPMEDEAA